MYRELKDRLDQNNRKEKKETHVFFKIENTIFKVSSEVTKLGIEKTRQFVKKVKSSSSSLTYTDAINKARDVIEGNLELPVNYKEEIVTAMDSFLLLTPNTIDTLLESEDDVVDATMNDMLNF
ncbi:MAG: hypothetical protein ACTSUV_03375 [Candidatus Ranarchaeia archaeon]